MTSELFLQKRQLRALVKNRLNQIQTNRFEIADRTFRNLLSFPAIESAKTIGVFVDFRNEIPTRYFIPKLFSITPHALNIVGVPFCVGKEMQFYKLEPPTIDSTSAEPIFHDLQPMSFGILEPTLERRSQLGAILSPQDFDVMLTPGVAFDRKGNRLGRGAGFYDRYLPKLRKDAVVIGIGYDEQIVDDVPVDGNDFKMDALVTPSSLLSFS